MNRAVSVTQLNAYIADKLKDDVNLKRIFVSGEISNFVNHTKTGHFYFTLKDKSSALKCVMFRADALNLNFIPKNGDSVIIEGRVQVFERDGVYQLYAQSMEVDGIGNLSAEFERLKLALEKEGLFKQKRPIPPAPSRICIITAKSGAALQDMLTVLDRRYPFATVFLIPALVQGKDAPESLVRAFHKSAETQSDVIIFGRGGGSIEDLWAFNDERVARAIFNSKIPTISAVGHEVDFTISDFVADLRAPTPSAAAELAVPDIQIYRAWLSEFSLSLKNSAFKFLDDKSQKLVVLTNEINLKSPTARIKTGIEKLVLLEQQIKSRTKSIYIQKESDFKKTAEIISVLNPINVLMRGYAIPIGENGKAIKSAEEVEIGDKINLKLYKGELSVTVSDRAL